MTIDSPRASIVKITSEPEQFTFYLNQPVIELIGQVGLSHYALKMPTDLMADLKQYALVDEEGRFQSGFTFCTHYTDPIKTWQSNILPRSGELVLRSVISLDGDVIYQVSEDFLQHPLCLEVTTVHQWLIKQLMNYLRINTGSYIRQILKATPIVVVGTTTAANLIGIATSAAQDPVTVVKPILFSCLSFALPLAEKPITGWVKNFIFRSLLNPKTLAGKLAKWVVGRMK